MPAEGIGAWLALGRSEFERRLVAVTPADWDRSTPCTEWNVRELVNHVVGQEFRIKRLLQAGNLEEYVRTREDDWLGDDALAAWRQGSAELDSVLAEPGVLARTVQYRHGPTTGEVAMAVRIFDMAVHTWDLARGIGTDDNLDPALVQWSLEALDGPLNFLWGSPKAELSSASPQQRLLRHCGRTP